MIYYVLNSSVREFSLVDVGASQHVPCSFTHFQAGSDACLGSVYGSGVLMRRLQEHRILAVYFRLLLGHCTFWVKRATRNKNPVGSMETELFRVARQCIQ